jgi:hypothetical protein
MCVADLFMDVLDFVEERVAVIWKDVRGTPEREMAAGAQRFPRAVVADLGSDPVPGGRGDDQIKRRGMHAGSERWRLWQSSGAADEDAEVLCGRADPSTRAVLLGLGCAVEAGEGV